MPASKTICLDPKVKEILANLKTHPQESYNSVVERLVKMAIDSDSLSEETIKRIEEGVEDIKNGRYCTEEEIAAELGLEK